MWLLLAIACTPDDAPASTPTEPTAVAPPPLRAPQVGDLLITQLYYSGAVPAAGTDHYFSDQYLELANTTAGPLDLGGVLVADAFGAAGAINPGMRPDRYPDTYPDAVVLSSVWRVPAGTRLEPGERLVIAHDGTNHRPFSTVDLSGARLEAFAPSGNDDDHPTVANLESVVYNGGFDWLITVFGPSVVVLDAGAALGSIPGPYGDLPTAPALAVLDAVETLMDADSRRFKRLPEHVDAGFTYVSGTYVGEAVHRRQTDAGWVDTDDSSADFVAGPPAPWTPPPSDAATGDGWVELGAGIASFTPLADGDAVELVAGLQGGWHVDTAIRFGGFGPDGVHLVYEAVDTDARRVSYVTEATTGAASVQPDGDGYTRVGDRIVFDIDGPDDVVGATLYLRVTAAIGDVTVSDEREVVIVDTLD